MLADRADTIDRSVETAHVWLNELAAELGTEGYAYAYRVRRAVLHAVRDRLTVDEAAQLSAQLPELIRGTYDEGWDPSRTRASYHDGKPFLERMVADALLAGESEALCAAVAVIDVVRHHGPAGEFEQVLHTLPPPARAVLRT